MQRAKAHTNDTQTTPLHAPRSEASLSGIKYCHFCEQLVHPLSAYYECKMEFCTDKDRVHRKCVYERLSRGANRIDIPCTNCRMNSSWKRRAWVDTIRSMPMKIVWILLAASIPMTIVKVLGFGVDDPNSAEYKWAMTQKVVFSHIFSSLLLTAFLYGCWWLLSTASGWTGYFCSRCCGCFSCCRRGRYEDIY